MDAYQFLKGDSPANIVKIEVVRTSPWVLLYEKRKDEKVIRKEPFRPFCWITRRLFLKITQGGSGYLSECGIGYRELRYTDDAGKSIPRMADGYCYLLQASKPMSYDGFLSVLGINVYPQNKDDILILPPTEQYMTYSGCRYFSGIKDYAEIKRCHLAVDTGGEKIHALINSKSSTYENSREGVACLIELLKAECPDVLAGYDIFNATLPLLKRYTLEGEDYISISNRDKIISIGGAKIRYKSAEVLGASVVDTRAAIQIAMTMDRRIPSDNLVEVSEFFHIKGQGENNPCFLSEQLEYHLNNPYFQLAKVLPIPFERVCVMGRSGIWQSLMLAWSYHNDLAVPLMESFDGIGIGGMSKMFASGVCENVVKLDFNSFYPNIVLSYGYHSEVDVMGVMPIFLKYFLSQRREYDEMAKQLIEEADLARKVGRVKEAAEKQKFARLKQNMARPFKIIDSSMYGSVSSQYFNWNSSQMGRLITATGRKHFRELIKYFSSLGYEPVAGTTDGCNFILPAEFKYTEDSPYICDRGRLCGLEGDVQEFNDKVLLGTLKISIEDIITRSVNIKRTNYAELLSDGSIKVVGGILSSNAHLPYINDFMSEGLRCVLEGRIQDLVGLYNDYLMALYNFDINPQRLSVTHKLAMPMSQYEGLVAQKRMERVAGYEVAKKYFPSACENDIIRYYNTGDKANTPDMEVKDGEVVLHCTPISVGEEYNADKYIALLKRAADVFLVCFSKEIRERYNPLFPLDPREIKTLTADMCPPVRHCPLKAGDEDIVEDVMVMEQKEVEFWDSVSI